MEPRDGGSIPLYPTQMEWWPSGLRRCPAKAVGCNNFRGFESHSFRRMPQVPVRRCRCREMTCCSCKKTLTEDSFYWKNKERGQRQPYCKSCKSDYNKRWYKKHAKEQKARARANTIKLVRFVREAKQVPCMDCGRSFPSECMDFDHVRGTKKNNISTLPYLGNLTALLEEMKKCDVVCSCCHRIRTSSRRSQVEKAMVS